MEGRGERLRILIIDDHADLADALAQVVLLLGHEVRVAGSAAGGLGCALEHDPDVVFLDVGLPDLDGCEVARRLRLQGCGALLVAFTGRTGQANTRRFHAAGFDHHVVKPALMDRLQPLFEEARARRAARAAGLAPRLN
ncbi:MAG: response regulator [Planctomycetes bacterium]|nr:response regulator [Planctomycetota bacterium]